MSDIVHLFPHRPSSAAEAEEAPPFPSSDEEPVSRMETARAISACLRSLLCDAEDRKLPLTAAALAVAIDAVQAELRDL